MKGIPLGTSPQLMSTLLKMGHGDEIVIADGNFPSESVGQNATVIRADGLSCVQLLEIVTKFLPLDSYATPVVLMDPLPGDKARFPGGRPPIWARYGEIVNGAEGREVPVEAIGRFEFYERAKRAYAVIATSETAIYANIILKKGVISNARL
uniref:L-fucose mutarotase n=1 Tax=Arcella intermedia TaxID=1963864 RepID=A0A6B2LNU6_9EUKA